MIGGTLVITVIYTIPCFTVNADGLAGMLDRTGIGISASLGKALATGI
jgi:hypothetical protein